MIYTVQRFSGLMAATLLAAASPLSVAAPEKAKPQQVSTTASAAAKSKPVRKATDPASGPPSVVTPNPTPGGTGPAPKKPMRAIVPGALGSASAVSK